MKEKEIDRKREHKATKLYRSLRMMMTIWRRMANKQNKTKNLSLFHFISFLFCLMGIVFFSRLNKKKFLVMESIWIVHLFSLILEFPDGKPNCQFAKSPILFVAIFGHWPFSFWAIFNATRSKKNTFVNWMCIRWYQKYGTLFVSSMVYIWREKNGIRNSSKNGT